MFLDGTLDQRGRREIIRAAIKSEWHLGMIAVTSILISLF